MASRAFRFFDPEVEGRFQAWREALSGLSIAEAARAVNAGLLREGGDPARWEPADHVLVVAPELARWLDSEEYEERACRAREAWRDRLELVP
jgi:hypothetical protein